MAPAPSWINKVNYIVDYWVDPCHAPLIVYLELALEPAGEALLTWFSFGLDDVIRGYVRPSKALGSNVRGRRGKKKVRKTRFAQAIHPWKERWRRTPGLGADVGGWIGGLLPGANELKGRRIHQFTRFLWIIDDVAQRALFALMVADITTDFLYEWATVLNESEFCKREKSGSLYATGPGSGAGGIIICSAANAPNVVFQEGSCGWVIGTGSVGPGHWSCISAMKLHNNSSAPVQHYQQALVNDLYVNEIQIRATQTVQPHSDFDSVATWHLDGPGSIVVNHCCLGGTCSTVGPQDVTLFGGP